MAKPTKRILDWASSGNAVDPGASKEANGWFIAERPPAYWWNWILQSFGEWLGYFETVTDTTPVAVLVIETDYSGGPGPSIIKEIGATASTITQVSSGTGDTGGRVKITYPTDTLSSGPIVVGTIYSHSSGQYLDYTINQKLSPTADAVEFCIVDSATVAPIDLDDIVSPFRVNLSIYGRGTV